MEYKCGKEIFFKRVCAFLIDALCIGLTFLLMVTIFDFTIMNSSSYKEAYQKQIEIGLQSHLFAQKEDGSIDFVSGSPENQDKAISDFYIWYEGNDSTYKEHKAEEIVVLFYLEDDGCKVIDD